MPETAPPPTASPRAARPRLWPGVAALGLLAFGLTVPAAVAPRTLVHFAGMTVCLLLALAGAVAWWALLSRVRWQDRLLVLAVFVGGAAAAGAALPDTPAQVLLLYAFPVVLTLWVGWLAVSGRLAWPARRAVLVLVIALGWASPALVRVRGVDGDMVPDLSWRWSKTSEQLLMEEVAGRPAAGAAEAQPAGAVVARPGDWPEFRGPGRDSRAAGVRVRTDWAADPPKLLWRHRVGLGWSSVAVVGDRLFTQEQRLAEECVVCYAAATGEELWKAAVPVRFVDKVGGDGPRATPTVSDGRLYAQGATGALVCLDAATGSPVWQRDIGADAGAKPPQWGYAGSPLVVDDLVVALPGGPDGKGAVAYRRTTGEPVWTAGEARHTYSSPQAATFFGTRQVLVLSDFGLESFNVPDGKPLWSYPATIRGMNRVVQPHVVGEGDVLLGTGAGRGLGTQLVKARKSGDGWAAEAGWDSPRLKPYFNDFVTHAGHAYGFDDTVFACVSLADGKGKWKEGRYGHGQVLLLADQALLLVLSDAGKVVLLDAAPDGHSELGSFQAVRGKTWNHPVVARGKLFVRNGEEMACYDVAEAAAPASAGN